MTNNLQDKASDKSTKTNKLLGILSLIIAILLSLSVLVNLPQFIRSIVLLVMAIFGQVEANAERIGYSFGYTAMTSLLIVIIIMLFKYSRKHLSGKAGVDENKEGTV